MNLVLATPTEQVMPCWSRTCSRMSCAIRAGRPSRRRAPATSRNASSSDRPSTSGVTDRKISNTAAETREYLPWLTGSTTACGQSRRARVIGIAECTPNVRAS